VNPIFLGTVSNGELVVNNHSQFFEYLRSLEGKEIQVVVGTVKKNRSNNENRYYWGVVIKILSEHTGYSTDEMHDALRMLFLIEREKQIPSIKSTATLSTVEFEHYLSQIRLWASTEMNCYIPEPNEVEF
jgi:hypothetical protein